MLNKGLWIMLGWIGIILGAIGAILPVLPSFPFLLLAVFSFGKSSKKLHDWFVQTKLYKQHFESYAAGQGMTMHSKIRILSIVTLTMGFGFFMMKDLFFPRLLLIIVWISHVIYFILKVDTIR